VEKETGMTRTNVSIHDLPPGVTILPPERTITSREESRESAVPTPAPTFPWLKIGVLLLVMLLYTGSPLDLIPDLIPIVGWFDDLLVNAGVFGMILRTVFKFYATKNIVRQATTKTVLRSMATRSVLAWLFNKK